MILLSEITEFTNILNPHDRNVFSTYSRSTPFLEARFAEKVLVTPVPMNFRHILS